MSKFPNHDWQNHQNPPNNNKNNYMLQYTFSNTKAQKPTEKVQKKYFSQRPKSQPPKIQRGERLVNNPYKPQAQNINKQIQNNINSNKKIQNNKRGQKIGEAYTEGRGAYEVNLPHMLNTKDKITYSIIKDEDYIHDKDYIINDITGVLQRRINQNAHDINNFYNSRQNGDLNNFNNNHNVSEYRSNRISNNVSNSRGNGFSNTVNFNSTNFYGFDDPNNRNDNSRNKEKSKMTMRSKTPGFSRIGDKNKMLEKKKTFQI